MEDGALARAERQTFYIHKHRFSSGDRSYLRTGVWAALKLAAYEDGIVLPHERTMKGPKADRLALMRVEVLDDGVDLHRWTPRTLAPTMRALAKGPRG